MRGLPPGLRAAALALLCVPAWAAVEALYTPDYLALKAKVLAEFPAPKPGKFGRFVEGVRRRLDTDKKVLALTFDACGPQRRGYNAALIELLRREKVPATLFVSGVWIDAHPKEFKSLAADPLFEIENHGLLHRLCSVDGQTRYKAAATRDLGEVVDEIELNARKIEGLTGRRPVFFRSPTVYIDETSAKVARRLGMEVVGYDVLPGDTVRSAPAQVLAGNIVRAAKGGSIVIMHFNHPRWREEETLRLALPALREKGFSFAKLQDYKLKER